MGDGELQWSVVSGQWSVVGGRWPVAGGWRDGEATRAGIGGTDGEGAHKGRPYRGRRGAHTMRGEHGGGRLLSERGFGGIFGIRGMGCWLNGGLWDSGGGL